MPGETYIIAGTPSTFAVAMRVSAQITMQVEALVRWQHPTLGLLEPRQFVPIAEQAGTIRGLTLWILEEVCRLSAEWRTAGVFLDVSVNISAKSTCLLPSPASDTALQAGGANGYRMG